MAEVCLVKHSEGLGRWNHVFVAFLREEELLELS